MDKGKKIIKILRSNNPNKGLKLLYSYFSYVQGMLLKMGATQEETDDIFQESIIILFEKVQDPKFELHSALKTFLAGISRNVFREHLRKRSNVLSEEYSNSTVQLPQIDIDEESREQLEKMQMIDKVLEQLGEKCKKILELYYVAKNSMDEIASKMGYNNSKTAKNQKYKCLERAKLQVQKLNNHPS